MQLNEIIGQHYDWIEEMGWHDKTVWEALNL